jgi:cytochrome b involved in lipid metabolism
MCIFKNTSLCIKINDKWYDVTTFKKIHPGGENILKKYKNKDATKAFYSINKHYNYLHALDEFLITDKYLIDKLNNKLNKLNK